MIKYSHFSILLGILLTVFAIGCKDHGESGSQNELKTISGSSNEDLENWPKPNSRVGGIAMYEKFNDIETIFRFKNDTTYVINFWATWCKPCIKELPYFEKVDSLYKDEKVKVILVSLDFPEKIESQLIPFVADNQIQSEVVVLLDGKYNNWIDKVSPEWTGAIPATYIYRGQKNKLIGNSFKNVDEIVDEIKPFL